MMIQPICARGSFRWHKKIDVAKHATARFIQHEIAQRLVFGDKAGLFPYGLARRRQDAADNHIANFSLRMAADDMDDL
jgi:hypothetical protein